MPRLSETLPYSPDVCQRCGNGQLFDSTPGSNSFWCDLTVGTLQRWQEHDAQDKPERILVILCETCAGKIIERHPRLYRLLDEWEPWPGCMPLCNGCSHHNETRCEHPDLKENGGAGLALTMPRPLQAFLDYSNGRGRQGCQITHYYGPVSACAGREIPEVAHAAR